MDVVWEINWNIVEKDFWFFAPIENTEFILVSWRLSGSEFIRESIRENFPSTHEIRKWGKTHVTIPQKYHNILTSSRPKIIFCLADPRDVATHIKTQDGGMHFTYNAHQFRNNEEGIFFLNENLKKIDDLLTSYQRLFGSDMIVLKYEDAVKRRGNFLNQISRFLNELPENKDDREKYDSPIYKPVGIYHNYFDSEILKLHTQQNINFYKRWGY